MVLCSENTILTILISCYFDFVLEFGLISLAGARKISPSQRMADFCKPCLQHLPGQRASGTLPSLEFL